MSDMSVHFSSATDQWATPQAFFDKYNKVWNFNTDVCAGPDNYKVAHYYTEAVDGLKQKWGGVCWMNPPYGRGIRDWVKKA